MTHWPSSAQPIPTLVPVHVPPPVPELLLVGPLPLLVVLWPLLVVLVPLPLAVLDPPPTPAVVVPTPPPLPEPLPPAPQPAPPSITAAVLAKKSQSYFIPDSFPAQSASRASV